MKIFDKIFVSQSKSLTEYNSEYNLIESWLTKNI